MFLRFALLKSVLMDSLFIIGSRHLSSKTISRNLLSGCEQRETNSLVLHISNSSSSRREAGTVLHHTCLSRYWILLEMVTLVRSAFSRFAFWKFIPRKSLPDKFCSDRLVKDKFAPRRIVPVKSIFRKSYGLSAVPDRFAPLKSCPVKLIFERSVLERSLPTKIFSLPPNSFFK